jgi:hypothetical protein
MGQFAVQLLQAGQAEYKAMEKSQEDARGRDFRIGAGVRHPACVSAQIETFVQPGGKRRQGLRSFFHT